MIFRIEASGRLALVGHESTRGRTPRSMALTPDGAFLVVANQSSRDVQVFAIDPASGVLTHRSSLDVGAGAFYVGASAVAAP